MIILCQPRKIITTEILGKAAVPDMNYESADRTPLVIETDYFGNERNRSNPESGPFEVMDEGMHIIKVWPRGHSESSPLGA